MQFQVIVVTDPQTHTYPQTHKSKDRTDNIHCAAKLSMQCNKTFIIFLDCTIFTVRLFFDTPSLNDYIILSKVIRK